MLETVGTPREFDFEPRDHIELGKILGAIDIERGAKVSGSRFYFLTGVGAELEFALINLANETAREHGFTQVIAPSMVKPRAMDGTGFLGQAADDVYRIEGQDMYLVGTSEVPMAAYHSDEILDGATLPLRYAAFSPCFRKEAGSHGKDTKGIIRVHWFDKVEMFVYTTLEESYAEHQRLLEIEKAFLDKLELAYRVIDTAAGDLGLSAQRKFDCEAWIPTQGKYRELTSTSNCTDFQTRRLDTRGRFAERDVEADRDPQRHALRVDPHHRGDPRDPPAGRRLGPGAEGAAAVAGRPRGAGAGRSVTEQAGDWTPRLVALDIDGTLLKWVEGAGTTHEEISPGGARRGAARPRRRRARRPRQRPVAARHDPRRRPARPARPSDARPALDRRLQRRRGVPLPAARGRPRGDVRRPARRSRRSSTGTRARWSRSRSAASATG